MTHWKDFDKIIAYMSELNHEHDCRYHLLCDEVDRPLLEKFFFVTTANDVKGKATFTYEYKATVVKKFHSFGGMSGTAISTTQKALEKADVKNVKSLQIPQLGAGEHHELEDFIIYSSETQYKV